MSKWQFQFSDSILNHKFGPVFVGARQNAKGSWVIAENLPEHVRQYLCLVKHNATWHFFEQRANTQALRGAIDCGEVLHWYSKAKCKGLVDIPNPTKHPKPAKIPRSVPAIRNLRQLCDHFGADTPQGLNHRIYKDTDCGASISVQTSDGKWHHNGDDWSGINSIIAFTIQTIVEGSDAEVNSDEFLLPVTVEEVDGWVKEMEQTADDLWREANEEDPEGDGWDEDNELRQAALDHRGRP